MRDMSCRQALAVSSSDIMVASRVSCSSTSPFSLSISLFTVCRRFLNSGSSVSWSCTMVSLEGRKENRSRSEGDKCIQHWWESLNSKRPSCANSCFFNHCVRCILKMSTFNYVLCRLWWAGQVKRVPRCLYEDIVLPKRSVKPTFKLCI